MSSYQAVVFHCTAHGWYDRQHFFQSLASAFRRRDKAVLYVSRPIGWPLSRGLRGVGRRISGGFLAEESGIHVVQPIVPNGARLWRRSRSWRRLRDRSVTRAVLAAMAEIGLLRSELLVWCYAPDATPLLRELPGARSIYWTGDDRALPDEPELLASVDHVFTACPGVLEERRAAVGERAAPMPMAVEAERYRAGAVPEELRALERPLLGYAGALNWRLDYALLGRVARESKGTVVLVGPATDETGRRETERLCARSNVKWLGHKGAEEAPAFVRALDVGLLPYLPSRFRERCNPTKFYEYLAAGLPVVSTAIPILEYYRGLAEVAATDDEFVELVASTASSGQSDPARIERRRRVAENHSYDRLVSLFDRHLDGSVRGLVEPGSRWCDSPA